MRSTSPISISGIGVLTPIGKGIEAFSKGLQEGNTHFSTCEFTQHEKVFRFPVAPTEGFSLRQWVGELDLPADLTKQAKRLRNLSESAAFGVGAALEAWKDAGLLEADIDPERVAIVASGSNTQQASLHAVREKYREKVHFLNPIYGLNFFDSDVAGTLSGLLGIQGEGTTIGAASASGNQALIHGTRLVQTGEYDLVLVVAPLMELSLYEYQGFTALGAMAAADAFPAPDEICRPFDEGHCGFVPGQSAGCIILESPQHAAKRGVTGWGEIVGYGIALDGNRNPNPSAEGEARAMRKALQSAGVSAAEVAYVNTHGTASGIGDKTELEAMLAVGLAGTKANSTKSLIGHGLTAAGLVECIAVLLQMKGEFLHPSHNLTAPLSDQMDWAGDQSTPFSIPLALSNSLGFGGVNTSIIIKNNNASRN